MEILEYLREGDLRGRWLALVVAVPVLAGVAAFVLGATTPARYEAAGRVPLVGVLGGGATSRDAVQRAELRFESLFESTPLRDAVTAELGRGGRHRPTSFAARPAGNGLVDVRLRAGDAATAEMALETATNQTLRTLLRAERRFEEARLGAAAATAAEAAARLDELHQGLGVADVAVAYADVSAEVVTLRNRVQTAGPVTAGPLEELLRARQDEQRRLGAAMVEYQRRSEALRRANDDEASATERMAAIDQELARLDAPAPALLLARVSPTSQMTQMAVLAMVAVGSAGAMALVAFGLARRSRQRPPDAMPASASAGAGGGDRRPRRPATS